MGNTEKESLAGKQSPHEVIVRREAQLEVQEAFRYHEDKSDGLGFEFLRSLDASLQSVRRNPLAYQTNLQRSSPRLASQISLRAVLHRRRKSNHRHRLLKPKS